MFTFQVAEVVEAAELPVAEDEGVSPDAVEEHLVADMAAGAGVAAGAVQGAEEMSTVQNTQTT